MSELREVKIGVAAYDDGSGYQATVTAGVGDTGPWFSVEVTYHLETSYWPELKQAVEDALRLVTKEPRP